MSRLNKLRALLPAEKIDRLLVTGLSNIRYLTGFTGSNALLVVSANDAVFYTDGRYTTQAAEEVHGAKVLVPKKGIWNAALATIRKSRGGKTGFDSSISFAAHQKIQKDLGDKRIAAVSGVVEKLRLVKDESEIAAIRASVELNSRVLAEILKLVRPGVTEMDLAAEMDYKMRRMGATGPSFETIVASGERSALPHARPSSRVVRTGEFLLFDHGTMLSGYCSDMTRTVWVGRNPSQKARAVYVTVLEAHESARDVVRAGVAMSAVDRAARKPIAKRGWAKYFSHSTGHGVGLDIHESPRIAAGVKDRLPAGAVVTIEPGVYLPGFGGVRIEDMVVVRENGAEVLTPSPKGLLEIA